MILNNIQKAAFELIQSDARFLYSLTDIAKKANKIDSNFIMMCQPYIGLFADGAEQWCKKVGFKAPSFSTEEKLFFASLRKSHKMFEKTYAEYKKLLMKELKTSDEYYRNRGIAAKLLGYYNVGTDLCDDEYCGNTLLCAAYSPLNYMDNESVGLMMQRLYIIAGKLAAFFRCTSFPAFTYDDINHFVYYKDYLFFDQCPLKEQTELGLVLFSVLCTINYATVFVEKYFTEEIPQKFKYAYLQYYYLCDFIKDMNENKNTHFEINNEMRNWKFRNCLAHYGLGQLMEAKDIDKTDILKGLTVKAFGMDYYAAKDKLFENLEELKYQIKEFIF